MGDKVVKKNTISKFVKPYVTVSLILGMGILLAVGVTFVWVGFDKRDQLLFYMMSEIGKAILLTVLVSIAINWYFKRQLSILEDENRLVEKQYQEEKERYEQEKDGLFRQTVHSQLDVLRKDVLQQTQEIADQAISFDALQLADVNRFYATRDEASHGIKNALLQRGVTSIKLIGISLNDFMRDENLDLHEAWVGIRRYIEKDILPVDAEKLDIRVLIIDPHAESAYLRASAEGRTDSKSRLNADVRDTMRDLIELEQRTQDHSHLARKVTFAAKVYQASPSMFLAWTPYTAFVQSYYFRPRHTRGHYPTIMFHNSGKEDCIHQELGFHFDWIWENASRTINEHMNLHAIGVADAIRDANIENMYYDYNESRARIIKLIERTQHCLWIKGISLHSYFTYANADLIEALIRAYERNVDVKILLINPNSEQAKLRSFREYLMSHAASQLEHFDDRARHGERLFTDTATSINFIRMQLTNRIQNRDLGVKLYNSGPECFTLLTDEAVLVEQYHYGKIPAAGRTGLILGGDIPVTEYRRIPEEQIADRKKDPYRLFRDSFEYVYNHCSIGLDEYKDTAI
jgi:hypothetical protein